MNPYNCIEYLINTLIIDALNHLIATVNKIPLVDNIDVSSTTPTTYTVYVWLDGEVADNSYANLNYIGYISAEAISK